MGSRWPGQETPTLRVDGAARRLSAFARQNDASFDSLRLCDRLSAITLDYVPLCRKNPNLPSSRLESDNTFVAGETGK